MYLLIKQDQLAEWKDYFLLYLSNLAIKGASLEIQGMTVYNRRQRSSKFCIFWIPQETCLQRTPLSFRDNTDQNAQRKCKDRRSSKECQMCSELAASNQVSPLPPTSWKSSFPSAELPTCTFLDNCSGKFIQLQKASCDLRQTIYSWTTPDHSKSTALICLRHSLIEILVSKISLDFQWGLRGYLKI